MSSFLRPWLSLVVGTVILCIAAWCLNEVYMLGYEKGKQICPVRTYEPVRSFDGHCFFHERSDGLYEVRFDNGQSVRMREPAAKQWVAHWAGEGR